MTDNEKAIEAAAKAISICNTCTGDGYDDDGNPCHDCFGSGADIRRALAAYEAAMWRPIEECPSFSDDCDPVLIYGGRHVEFKIAIPDGEWWRNSGIDVVPTHFRPLPSPPEGRK